MSAARLLPPQRRARRRSASSASSRACRRSRSPASPLAGLGLRQHLAGAVLDHRRGAAGARRRAVGPDVHGDLRRRGAAAADGPAERHGSAGRLAFVRAARVLRLPVVLSLRGEARRARRRRDDGPTTRDPRVVLTLDAGGTNFVFSAVQGGARGRSSRSRCPRTADDLDACLQTIVRGLHAGEGRGAGRPPVGDQLRLPRPGRLPARDHRRPRQPARPSRAGSRSARCSRTASACRSTSTTTATCSRFGEAMAGLLPDVNGLLEQAGSPKRYRNLFGATFGTGFGGGIVQDGRLWHRRQLGRRRDLAAAQQDRPALERRGVGQHPRHPARLRRAGRRRLRGGARAEGDLRDRRRAGARRARRRRCEAFRRMGEAAGDALATRGHADRRAGGDRRRAHGRRRAVPAGARRGDERALRLALGPQRRASRCRAFNLEDPASSARRS